MFLLGFGVFLPVHRMAFSEGVGFYNHSFVSVHTLDTSRYISRSHFFRHSFFHIINGLGLK
jgi:hypothetical protein